MSDAKRHFPLQFSFPDAAAIFSAQYKAVDEIKTDCLVGLDTNVLLAPYSLGSKGLAGIKQTYEDLLAKERLIIPGQVAREFARSRSVKLGEITKALQDQSSRAAAPMREVTDFLSYVDGYQRATQLSRQIAELCVAYQKEIDRVVKTIRAWRSDDPVSEMYRQVFPRAVVDLNLSEEEQKAFAEELKYRYEHSIPPGFNDRAKVDGGAGDLLIWKTILKVASEKQRDLVFVTVDQKNDWWVQSANGPFQPRCELMEEYRRASHGRTLHLLVFSDFLSVFGAKEEVVSEVRKVELATEAIDTGTIVQPASSIAPAFGQTSQDLARARNRLRGEINQITSQIEQIEAGLKALPMDANYSLTLPWNRQRYALETVKADLLEKWRDKERQIQELERQLHSHESRSTE